jgi:hypothetical protein
MISEENVVSILKKILNEETRRVHRNDYNKVLFKIDEVESQINESIKELRKLMDSIPDGLKTITNSKVRKISDNLTDANVQLKNLKHKVKEHRKSSNQQNIDEKK